MSLSMRAVHAVSVVLDWPASKVDDATPERVRECLQEKAANERTTPSALLKRVRNVGKRTTNEVLVWAGLNVTRERCPLCGHALGILKR